MKSLNARLPPLIALALLLCGTAALEVDAQNHFNLTPTPLTIEKAANYGTVRPIYELAFKGVSCMFELRVNDVLLHTVDSVGGHVSSVLPINVGILQSGKQQISVKILPLAGKQVLNPNAEVQYQIRVIDLANLKREERLLSEYAVVKVDPAKKEPYLTHTTYFDANVPYSIKAYQAGTDLTTVTGLKEKLLDAYKQVGAIAAKGDAEQLKRLLANSEIIASTTMYASKEASNERISEFMAILKSGFKLEPVPANATMKIFANGKLAGLFKPDGSPALTFINAKKKGEELSLELSFYIPKGKTELEAI